MKDRFRIDGEEYSAINDGGPTWMIRWWKNTPSEDPDNNFREALLTVETTDAEVAIKAAIARGSWA